MRSAFAVAVLLMLMLTATETMAGGPVPLELSQANPVRLGVPQRLIFANEFGPVRIELLDAITGRRWRLLFNNRSGGDVFQWLAADDVGLWLKPGIYLLRFQHPRGVITRKLVVVP